METNSKSWIRPLTWLMRLGVGATFTFSGFVKAIDPWGTLYKFEDYMAAMNLPDYTNLLLVGVFALCAFEFAVGVFLLAGCFRRSAPIGALLLMAVMLPLTLWIAVADPVDDCGCFGDAFKLSNWTTFWKNVVLTAAIAFLLRFNASCRCLIRPYLQWMAFIFTTAFIVIIGLAGYIYQPLIDFRPFPVGAEIATTDSDDESSADNEAEGITFIYEKDGVEKSFSLSDELPDEDDGWTFVRRESAPEAEAENKESANENVVNADDHESFRVWSEDGEEDVTRDVLDASGRELLLLMPDLKSVSISTTWQINSLYNWAHDNDIDMIGIVAGSREDIERWRDISLAAYPLYTAEDTQIKMLARGNPAVVYVNDGRIVWKSSLRAIETEDFQSADTSRDPASYARDDRSMLLNASGFYLLAMALLMFLSYLPALGRFFPSKLRKSIARRDAKMTQAESQFRTLAKDTKDDTNPDQPTSGHQS